MLAGCIVASFSLGGCGLLGSWGLGLTCYPFDGGIGFVACAKRNSRFSGGFDSPFILFFQFRLKVAGIAKV
jgi:hypothetical protein